MVLRFTKKKEMASVANEEDYFEGAKGLKIFYQAWIPAEPKAVVQFLHGFTEHSGRFPYLIETLSSNGYAVYANDHRGHGKSEGLRLHVDSMSQFVEDAKRLNTIIQEKHPRLPIFLIGYSLGSIIACSFLRKYWQSLAGAVLVGTASSIKLPMKALLLMKIVSRLMPRRRFGPLVDARLLTSNADVVDSYEKDPLVTHERMTLRFANEIVNGFVASIKHAKEFRLPTLVQCGSEDKLIEQFSGHCNEESLNAMFTMADKTIKMYKGLYHEVYNEPEEAREEVLSDLVRWLDGHL